MPVSVAISDFCVSVDEYIEQGANNKTSLSKNTFAASGLQTVMKCLANDSYSPVSDLSYKGMNQTLSSVNNYTVSCCNKYFTEQNITSLNVTDFPVAYQPQIQIYLNDYNTYTNLLAEIQDIANCTLVRNAYKSIRKSLCGTTM